MSFNNLPTDAFSPHSGVRQTPLKALSFRTQKIEQEWGREIKKKKKETCKADQHAAAEQRRDVKAIDSVTMEGFGSSDCPLFTW